MHTMIKTDNNLGGEDESNKGNSSVDLVDPVLHKHDFLGWDSMGNYFDHLQSGSGHCEVTEGQEEIDFHRQCHKFIEGMVAAGRVENMHVYSLLFDAMREARKLTLSSK